MIKKKLIDLTSNDVEIIIRNNYDDIFKYCFWKVRDYTDAEDLVLCQDLVQVKMRFSSSQPASCNSSC